MSAILATPPLDGDVSSDDVVYAEFKVRFLALVLDVTFSLLFGAVPALLLLALLRNTSIAVATGLVAWLAVALAYQVVATAHGGGFGMRITGIQIIRADNGAKPGFRRAFRRVFALSGFGFVPILGSLLQLADGFWMVKDPHKQTWHDKAAGTYVVQR